MTKRGFRGTFAVASAWLVLLTTAAAAVSAQAADAAKAGGQFKAFKIGNYSAYALKDGGLQEPVDGKSFVVGQSNEEVGAVLKAGGKPADHFEFSIQPLLVKADSHVLLFDSGAGSYFGDIAGMLPKSMAAAGLKPDEVTDIFISHAHGDHIGGLVTASGTLTFPKAVIHMSAPEWKWFSGLSPEDAKMFGIQGLTALVAAMRPKVVPFEPGATILPGLVKAVEIKGHTPGHSGYLVGTDSANILVFGDAMHSHLVSVQKPSWNVAFDLDKATGAASRAALVESSAASGQLLYSEHFPFPGVGKIVKKNGGYVWAPD